MSDLDGWGGRPIEPNPRDWIAQALKAQADRIAALETRPGGGGGGGGAVVTHSLPAVTGSGSIDLGTVSATVLAVSYSAACRLRLYRTEAGLIADASRAFTTPYVTSTRRALLYDFLALGPEVDTESPLLASTEDPDDPNSTLIHYAVSGGPVDINITVRT